MEQAWRESSELNALLTYMELPAGFTPSEFFRMLDKSEDGKLRCDEFCRSMYRLIDGQSFQHACLLHLGINGVKAGLMETTQRLEQRLIRLEAELHRCSTPLEAMPGMNGQDVGRSSEKLPSPQDSERDSVADGLRADQEPILSRILSCVEALRQELPLLIGGTTSPCPSSPRLSSALPRQASSLAMVPLGSFEPSPPPLLSLKNLHGDVEAGVGVREAAAMPPVCPKIREGVNSAPGETEANVVRI